MKNKNSAIDVNSDMSPISKQPIDNITPGLWVDMPLSKLGEQQIYLTTRINLAMTSGQYQIAKQMQLGLNELSEIIKYKSEQQEITNFGTFLI